MGNLQKIQRFKFKRASFRSSGGRDVDRLLVMRRRDALVKGGPLYRESRYRESRVYCLFYEIILIYFFRNSRYITVAVFVHFRNIHLSIFRAETITIEQVIYYLIMKIISITAIPFFVFEEVESM